MIKAKAVKQKSRHHRKPPLPEEPAVSTLLTEKSDEPLPYKVLAELMARVDLLERAVSSLISRTTPVVPPYLSNQFNRRDGTMYGKPPSEGSLYGNDPARHLRSADKRVHRHERARPLPR